MIAVTGGAGAMGTRLCRKLLSGGTSVRVLDLDRPGVRDRLVGQGAEFRAVDVTEPTSLSGALEGCQAVVHLAGLLLAAGRRDRLDQVNRQGTENVISEAAKSGARRFVHISSISVTYRLANHYSESKRLAELAVQASGLDWTILRPTLAWGDPSCAEHEAFRSAVKRHRILPLPAGGEAKKSPVHVDDLADAFASTLRCPSSIGRILALSGSQTVSLREMAQEIQAARGGRSRILSIPSWAAAVASRVLPPLARAVGINPPGDWQTYTGLVEDACPSWREAGDLLDWNPRGWKAQS
ncbi:MAG: NAD(P)H-binding protein [Fibrobacterota bacterium]|nr:NAD(P)H-binding protein [Fibrobacterota bacterium]QQS06150.1 MAG: NAD(P)H-binding protein [Fibrobacterota bacterium]